MELNKTFIDGLWSKEINVTSFVQTNITPYVGDASFLQGPTDRTKHIWNLCLKALEEERANNGVRSLDNKTVSTITSHKAGYIDKEQELIVGLQTDQLLKRAIKPFGGINVVSRACKENGVDVDEKVKGHFHALPQDAQRRRIRRLHRGDPFVPLAGLPDGPAGQLRPRPHHRRLPPSGPLRHRPADRSQDRGPARPDRPDDRRPHPPARRGRGADQGTQGDPHDGRILRTGPEPSGALGAGGRTVGLHGLPRRREGAGRRRNVAGQRFVVPRHLHRVRSGPRQHRRKCSRRS